MLTPLLRRGPELSPSKRGQIIGMRLAGATFRKIGRELVVTADAARKVWNRYQQTVSVYSAPRSGWPKVLTERDSRHLKRYITHDRETRRESLTEMIRNLNLHSSADTICHVSGKVM
jgi:hypothetical protein